MLDAEMVETGMIIWIGLGGHFKLSVLLLSLLKKKQLILLKSKEEIFQLISFTTTLEEVPLYGLKDQIQKVLDSSEYEESMSDTNRVECKDSMYSVIQYSKFKWLKESSKINPFDSKYFFWLDAGASRFIERSLYNEEYPSKLSLEKLDQIDNSFLIQYNTECYPDLVNPKTLSENYLWDNRSFVCGSMFGGNAKSIDSVDRQIDEVMEIMLETGCMNNEQIALGYLCKNDNDDLFVLF